jgi:hypothetical protein
MQLRPTVTMSNAAAMHGAIQQQRMSIHNTQSNTAATREQFSKIA